MSSILLANQQNNDNNDKKSNSISNAYSTCLSSLLGVEPVSKCFTAISNITCNDLKKEVGDLSSKIICKDLQEFVNGIQDPNTINSIEKVGTWYDNVFAPCLSSACATTPTPVTTQQLVDAPKKLARTIAEKQLSSVELFMVRYGIYIGIILIAIIFILLFILIGRRKCPEPESFVMPYQQ
jgi:hypothetical protein